MLSQRLSASGMSRCGAAFRPLPGFGGRCFFYVIFGDIRYVAENILQRDKKYLSYIVRILSISF